MIRLKPEIPETKHITTPLIGKSPQATHKEFVARCGKVCCCAESGDDEKNQDYAREPYPRLDEQYICITEESLSHAGWFVEANPDVFFRIRER